MKLGFQFLVGCACVQDGNGDVRRGANILWTMFRNQDLRSVGLGVEEMIEWRSETFFQN